MASSSQAEEQRVLSERLQILLDIEAIKALKATYGRLADGLFGKRPISDALEQLRELFSADAVAEFVGIAEPLHGREAIARYFSETLSETVASMWHSFHSPHIEVDGGRARGSWTVYVVMKVKGSGSQEPHLYFGRYEDEYVRTAAGWRQSRLIFRDESH